MIVGLRDFDVVGHLRRDDGLRVNGGRHSPGASRPRPAREPDKGRKAKVKKAVLWLLALAAVAFTLTVVRGFIRLDDDLDNPEGGFSGWQCAGRSGTCDP
ncbi:hypothetical protein [Streptomyces sp. AS02]|uniref:hypothetical protein n=1 Tax=Streptomyces sp. AS02 TaxID=2938946 RepID=UPI0020226051|nr:hypothetical protein [Streptomyces sp. AS02]MCL8014476.1 hypothetical protein [Streptomyces sp. AS02]